VLGQFIGNGGCGLNLKLGDWGLRVSKLVAGFPDGYFSIRTDNIYLKRCGAVSGACDDTHLSLGQIAGYCCLQLVGIEGRARYDDARDGDL